STRTDARRRADARRGAARDLPAPAPAKPVPPLLVSPRRAYGSCRGSPRPGDELAGTVRADARQFVGARHTKCAFERADARLAVGLERSATPLAHGSHLERHHLFPLPCPMLSTARNASCGTSTAPTCFIRFFPFFWFSSSLRLRELSPP